MIVPMENAESSGADRISRVIFEHAARISREQDIDVLLRLNADLARDLAGADRCTIWLADEESRELWTKVAHGIDPIRIPMGSGIVGACVSEDRPFMVNDPSHDSRFYPEVDGFSGYHTLSLLAVPLRAEGKVIGALQVLNKPGGFTESDIELLGLTATYAAAAIQAQRLREEAEAARLFYHELKIARDVQQKLFPQDLPPVRGLEYAGVCVPAKFVGGDYYDFLDLAGGMFAFTIGDVAGKGISAAVLMASIQALVHSQLLHAPLSVSSLMTELNQTVFRFSPEDKYTTLFCGVLNPERTTLTYVNAGQVRPMVLRADESEPIFRPSESGFPVGLWEQWQYDEAVVNLHAGDLIVSFSDGISEVRDSRQQFWTETAIKSVLRKHRHSSVHTIVESLIGAANEFAAGVEQFDDMTAIAIRVK
jgi:phosphoserine phosphatase RsbU/P